jgi:hypothetical protein
MPAARRRCAARAFNALQGGGGIAPDRWDVNPNDAEKFLGTLAEFSNLNEFLYGDD